MVTPEAIDHEHVPGEPGLWVLIFGELAVFAVLFIAFVYDRGRQPEVYNAGQDALHQGVGLINTLLLLSSSLAVITAVRAIRAQYNSVATGAVAVALCCGVAFLVNKAFEWVDLLRSGPAPESNRFVTYFLALTAVHAVHVLIGLGILSVLLVFSRRVVVSEGRMAFVEGGACYWHMVDVVWIVLFALLYVMR